METASNIFKSLSELRMLLTSNFDQFKLENKINLVKIDWNGDIDAYEFKCQTVDFWVEFNTYGLPTFGIRGKIESKYKNEFIIDSIIEISDAINQYIISHAE